MELTVPTELSNLSGDGWLILLVCIPLLILATWLGGRIQKRFSQEQFIKASYILLIVVAVVLLLK